MNITLTMRQFIRAYQSLEILSDRTGLKRPAIWWIGELKRRMRPEYDAYIKEQTAVFERLGRRTKNPAGPGEVLTLKAGNERQAAADLDPILDETTTVTSNVHALKWLGGGVADGIEPVILARLRPFFERPAEAAADTATVTLTMREIEEAIRPAEALGTHRVPEALAWWVSDVIAQLDEWGVKLQQERVELQAKHGTVKGDEWVMEQPAHRQAVEAMLDRTAALTIAPRSLDVLGDVSDKTNAAMIESLFFMFTEPADDPTAQDVPAP